MEGHLELDEESFVPVDIGWRADRRSFDFRMRVLHSVEAVYDRAHPHLAKRGVIFLESKGMPGAALESAAPLFVETPVFALAL